MHVVVVVLDCLWSWRLQENPCLWFPRKVAALHQTRVPLGTIVGFQQTKNLLFIVRISCPRFWFWTDILRPLVSFPSLLHTTSSSSVHSLSASNASSFKNRHFIISFTVSCQSAVMDPSAFLTVDIFPVISLFATILCAMNHGSLFMLSSTYFFQTFPLAARNAVLYLSRQSLKAFCALSLVSKSSILFNLLLYRRVCFLMFERSEVHHVIFRHPSICVIGIVLTQALVIQFMNSIIASFGLLDRLDGSVLVSSSCSFSQSAFSRLYNSPFSLACRLSLFTSCRPALLPSSLASLFCIFAFSSCIFAFSSCLFCILSCICIIRCIIFSVF